MQKSSGDDRARAVPLVLGHGVLEIENDRVSATFAGALDPRGPVAGHEQHRPVGHADAPPRQTLETDPKTSRDMREHLRRHRERPGWAGCAPPAVTLPRTLNPGQEIS